MYKFLYSYKYIVFPCLNRDHEDRISSHIESSTLLLSKYSLDVAHDFMKQPVTELLVDCHATTHPAEEEIVTLHKEIENEDKKSNDRYFELLSIKSHQLSNYPINEKKNINEDFNDDYHHRNTQQQNNNLSRSIDREPKTRMNFEAGSFLSALRVKQMQLQI